MNASTKTTAHRRVLWSNTLLCELTQKGYTYSEWQLIAYLAAKHLSYLCYDVSCMVLSTSAGRWDGCCWQCLRTKKGGYQMSWAKAQLGFTSELNHTGMGIRFRMPISSYTVPFFHLPLRFTVLAPGWVTHAKRKIAKKIKLSKRIFRKEKNNLCSDVNTDIKWGTIITKYKNRIN